MDNQRFDEPPKIERPYCCGRTLRLRFEQIREEICEAA
jgi:hypothetical protein